MYSQDVPWHFVIQQPVWSTCMEISSEMHRSNEWQLCYSCNLTIYLKPQYSTSTKFLEVRARKCWDQQILYLRCSRSSGVT